MQRIHRVVIFGDCGTGALDRRVRIWMGVMDGLRRDQAARTVAAEVRLRRGLVELLAAAEGPRGGVWSMHCCAN